MGLTRLYQLVAAQEGEVGVYATDATLFQNVNAGLFISDPSLAFTPETFQREVNSGSLTQPTPLVGATTGEFTFGVSCGGRASYVASTGFTLPLWDPLLRACGFKLQSLRRLALGAWTTGDIGFQHGELLNVGGDAGAGGWRAFFDEKTGSTEMYVYGGDFTAAVSSSTIIGLSSGAQVTSGTNAGLPAGEVHGHGYAPISIATGSLNFTGGPPATGQIFVGATSRTTIKIGTVQGSNAVYKILGGGPMAATETFNPVGAGTAFTKQSTNNTLVDIPSLSMALVEDGRSKVLAGARGSVQWSGELGQPVSMNFTFQGAFEKTVDRVGLEGSFDELTPPNLLGVDARVGTPRDGFTPADDRNGYADAETPCINSWSADIGHGVSARRCMKASKGVVDFSITSRAATMTFDPEVEAEATYPFLTDMANGVPFYYDVSWGDPTDVGNFFRLQCPSAQITGETPGDRDGIGVSELTAGLSSKTPTGGEGQEREILFAILKA